MIQSLPHDRRLETAIRSSWSEASAAPDSMWSDTRPATGQCDVTSLIVRERLGGDLRLAQVFRDGVLTEHHYWNVLPDGTEVDLTFSQFSGDEEFRNVVAMDQAFFDAAPPMRPELAARLDRFRTVVGQHVSPTDPLT